ncbi:MAG: hypothetical protein LBI38_04075 [Oscillospiraceae bacterium]|nr:hypothetical protein [Oscillospiraceae bacterium]
MFEPGLDDALTRNLGKTFTVTDTAEEAAKTSDVRFFCVGTPANADGINLPYGRRRRLLTGAARALCRREPLPILPRFTFFFNKKRRIETLIVQSGYCKRGGVFMPFAY